MAASYSNCNMQINFTSTITTGSPTIPSTIQVTDTLPAVQPAAGTTTFNGTATLVGTVASGTPVVVNLLTGLVDQIGNTVTPDKIVGYKAQCTSGTGTITLGGGTNAVMPAQNPIGNGDVAGQTFTANPLAVVTSSSQNLQIVSSSGTCGYQITINTRSA